MVLYTACIRTRFRLLCYYLFLLDISTCCMRLTHEIVWAVSTLDRIVWYVQGYLVDVGAERLIFVQFVLHSTLWIIHVLTSIWYNLGPFRLRHPHLFHSTCTAGASDHLFHNSKYFFFSLARFLTYIDSGNSEGDRRPHLQCAYRRHVNV